VGNYVIENPSDLGNFMIADNWRPQLTAGDPYRPGLVARVWPGSLGSRAETYARWPELFGLGGR